MAFQEGGPRRGVFGIGVRGREAPAPVLPKPETKPTPEPEKPKRKKRKKLRIALAGLAALGAVEVTGAVIEEQINNQPASMQTIPADLAWPWNLGRSLIEDINYITSNKNRLPEIPPESAPAPTAEAIIPKSFVATEEPINVIRDNGEVITGVGEKGIVKRDVNTMPLKEGMLETIVNNNPDITPEDTREVRIRHMFWPIKSDKNVTFERSVVDATAINEQGDRYFIGKRGGGPIYDVNNGDAVILPVLQAEIFRFMPLVVDGVEYYHSLLIKGIVDGKTEYYIVEIYRGGNVLDVEIADGFKNAPVVTRFQSDATPDIPYYMDSEEGIPASITFDENGNPVAPELMKLKKDGMRMIISATGAKIEYYTYIDESGNVKIINPS